jgi:hypothetical protein
LSRRSYGVVVGFVALGLAIGCDGDSNSFQSTLPPNKRLADLTPAERDQLCMDLRTFGETVLPDLCGTVALLTAYARSMVDTTATDAQLQATCTDATRQCIANGVTTTCEPAPPTCTATVGEFGACLSDSSAALQTPPCNAVRRATLATTIAALQNQPPSQTCTTLEMKCPGATTAMATSMDPLSVYEQRGPE